MNWMHKFKGKIGRPDGPAPGGVSGLGQELRRKVGGTVVRAGERPATTMAKPGIRFQPNHDVTVDLRIKRLLGGGARRQARMWLWEVPSGRCRLTLRFALGFGGCGWVCLSADARFACVASPFEIWEIGNPLHRTAGFRLARLSSSADALEMATRFQRALADAQEAARAGQAVHAYRHLRRARIARGYSRAKPALPVWAKLYVSLRRRGVTDSWPQRTFSCGGGSGHLRVGMFSGIGDEILKPVEPERGPLFEGRPDLVTSACLSSDGLHALSGDSDRTLKLWEVESGLCLHVFEGHQGRVTSVSLSSDGLCALSGSFDKTLKLWELATGRCVRTFETQTIHVESVCLSADGLYVLGLDDTTLKLWDVESGLCLQTFEGGPKCGPARLTAGGRYVLLGSSNGLTVWDVGSGRCVRTFGHGKVHLSADGRFAPSESGQQLKLWEVESEQCLRTFDKHFVGGHSLFLSADGRHALCVSYDGLKLELWDVENGTCLRTMVHEEEVHSAVISADGQHVLSVCGNGVLTAWFLGWELEENEAADWDDGARPYLELFLCAHVPYVGTLPKDRQPTDTEITRALTRQGGPKWSEDDFKGLLYTLGCAGYRWLRPKGVRRELEQMTAALRDGE